MNKRLTERAEIRFIFSKELKQCFALSSMLTVKGASLMNDSTFKILDTVDFLIMLLCPAAVFAGSSYFALVRKFSLNILRRDKGKGSLVTKRLKAGWSIDYLFSLLEI